MEGVFLKRDTERTRTLAAAGGGLMDVRSPFVSKSAMGTIWIEEEADPRVSNHEGCGGCEKLPPPSEPKLTCHTHIVEKKKTVGGSHF